jgi:hypothetical protein
METARERGKGKATKERGRAGPDIKRWRERKD